MPRGLLAVELILGCARDTMYAYIGHRLMLLERKFDHFATLARLCVCIVAPQQRDSAACRTLTTAMSWDRFETCDANAIISAPQPQHATHWQAMIDELVNSFWDGVGAGWCASCFTMLSCRNPFQDRAVRMEQRAGQLGIGSAQHPAYMRLSNR